MKYTPKALEGNVNVTNVSPVKEFFVLMGGVLAIVIIIYAALGIAVDQMVERIPQKMDSLLGVVFSAKFSDEKRSDDEIKLQRMVDELIEKYPQMGSDYRVHIVDSRTVNAVAMPGGNIIIFSQLLSEIESENELAFILAHELGHFANRDHLRGLGRGLILIALSTMIMGQDSAATDFLMNSLVTAEMKFSQSQEKSADAFALEMLSRRYGHVSGAGDFFKRLNSKNKAGKIRYYFASHPHPEDRIKALDRLVKEKNYSMGEIKGVEKNLLPSGQE
ncbi:MAG: M48 family metallopeptidase [Deltaproteobacteria bacterium]|nr:M48 family metallopeptidase [Deltaproteobacteria bacterium]